MKKTLFIISLRYPLINALNIKTHELKEKKADIIIDDTIRPDTEELIYALRESNIFEKVFFVNPDGYDGLKKFFKNKFRGIGLKKSVCGTYKNMKLCFENKFQKKKFLKNSIISGGDIDLNAYDEVYICSGSKVARICLEYLTKKIINIHLIEEGIRDYYTDVAIMNYKKIYSKQNIIIHLYEPELTVYDKNIKNVKFKKIPKISYDDCAFKTIVNNIFNYDDSTNLDDKIIFFEQVAEPMPKYLKQIGFFKKIFLRNAIKNHKKEHDEYLNKVSIVNTIIKILIKEKLLDKFTIKLHPRTKRGISLEWREFIMGDKDNSHTIPWEVYCMNQNFKNNLWLTINSSSLLNKILVFDKTGEIKLIFFK